MYIYIHIYIRGLHCVVRLCELLVDHTGPHCDVSPSLLHTTHMPPNANHSVTLTHMSRDEMEEKRGTHIKKEGAGETCIPHMSPQQNAHFSQWHVTQAHLSSNTTHMPPNTHLSFTLTHIIRDAHHPQQSFVVGQSFVVAKATKFCCGKSCGAHTLSTCHNKTKFCCGHFCCGYCATGQGSLDWVEVWGGFN